MCPSWPPSRSTEAAREGRDADLAVVGAGAAGLMAATWAPRTAPAALVFPAPRSGGTVRPPFRVAGVARDADGFVLPSAAGGTVRAARGGLATGGRRLPKTGTDGGGYALAQALGHTLTPHIF